MVTEIETSPESSTIALSAPRNTPHPETHVHPPTHHQAPTPHPQTPTPHPPTPPAHKKQTHHNM